jgi:hypothetical protein
MSAQAEERERSFNLFKETAVNQYDLLKNDQILRL